ncbi:MAG: dUTP diphosphatase [Lachnospiraceae bacterium]|nr:dUTP diphosphatase [Lachnospiraceae bacterium]
MDIKIKKLSDGARIPERGSDEAAGYDLFACMEKEVEIAPHTTYLVHTGIAVAIPTGYFGGVYARSGLSAKEGLRPANCTGVIDADYRGEIMVALHNDSETIRTIAPGQKVAQLIIQAYEAVSFSECETLPETDRGAGGFGSTGKM